MMKSVKKPESILKVMRVHGETAEFAVDGAWAAVLEFPMELRRARLLVHRMARQAGPRVRL
jgi:hypothetical protein